MFLPSAIVPKFPNPRNNVIAGLTGFESKTLDCKSDAPLEGKTTTPVYRNPLKMPPFMILQTGTANDLSD